MTNDSPDAPARNHAAYCLDLLTDGEWHIVGQYPTRQQAEAIAADYRSRGERTRITGE